MLVGRMQVPPSVKRGEPFEVRVLVQHPMETGFRRDFEGQLIPMNIIDKLVCRYGGHDVFSAELGSGMAANPYIAFYVVAQSSGELVLEWSEDRGDRGRMSATINVA
jgi:sulfur-oxidizing protein SoxZ